MRKITLEVAGIVIIACLLVTGCGANQQESIKTPGEVPVYPGAAEYEYPDDGVSRLEFPRYTTDDPVSAVVDWYREWLEDLPDFEERLDRGPGYQVVMLEYRTEDSNGTIVIFEGWDSLRGLTVIEVREINPSPPVR